ncbi:lambda-exonuclease family protein [Nonomuraea basaltis]|uniref:lambda-exonuclease family protein n=1 Tax=Nonomuraea basaltis TaxID=2495887 RepID=UPI0014865129|nr:YqaJ viral recombinase family protein [Nonomuraea basaltis]
MATLTTPGAVLLGEFEHGSAAWHEARSHRIGGSDIGVICGVSKWTSRYALWCEKAGLVQPDPTTREQARGHYLEQGIADWYADQNPDVQVVKTGTWVSTRPGRDYQLANPDRLLVHNGEAVGGLEIKTDAEGRDWGQEGTDEVPYNYLAQVKWYMDTTGLPYWDFAVLGSHLTFRWYRVYHDPEDAGYLREQAEKFLLSIAWDEMPPLDGHDTTYRAVLKQHQLIDRNEKFAIPDDLAARVLPALAAEAEVVEEAKKARAELAAAMGTAGSAYYDGVLYAIRKANGGGPPSLTVQKKNLKHTPELQGAAA